jgi:NADPH-dependent 2,4-dienoyl-CoA reductase/sulfur reductase-like enzyme
VKSKTRSERLLVIGGCAAGMSAASKAKRMNKNLHVIALEKTPHVSYSACGIPYYVADLVREPRELIAITPEEFRERRGIEVLIRHEVVEIQPVKKTVTAINLDSGKEIKFDYDKLVIAVGGAPKKPNLPGMDAKNVFTLQTLQDGIHIRNYIDENRPKKVAIIGGGYIAMEMTEAFRQRSLEVTVIQKRDQILSSFEPDIVEKVAAELANNEVKILTNAEATALEISDGGSVTNVIFNDGQQKLPVDLVLVSTGLAANTKLAEIAGVRAGNTGAIAVDWKMQTNVPSIYAAGDCVEVKHLVSGKPDYIPLGPTANKQGRVAGENIGGGTATFKGVVGTTVFKTFNLEVAQTGLNIRQAKQSGFEPDSITITENSKAGYYPGVKPITVTVIWDKRSRRLLGAQMVGEEGVSKRIDVFAAALTNKMTLDEMAYLDVSYAPPFAPVWDPVLVAVNAARGKR